MKFARIVYGVAAAYGLLSLLPLYFLLGKVGHESQSLLRRSLCGSARSDSVSPAHRLALFCGQRVALEADCVCAQERVRNVFQCGSKLFFGGPLKSRS